MSLEAIIAKVRQAGSQVNQYKTHLIAPEAGGFWSVMAGMPAVEFLELASAVGNENLQRLTIIADHTEIDGKKFPATWFEPLNTESLRQWRMRVGVSFEDLDTTPRQENPATGLMEQQGLSLSARLYRLVGYDLKNYQFLPAPLK